MSSQNEEPIDVDKFRRVFLKYTRRAFHLLPEIEDPKILDVGCGNGIPTLELAEMSGGNVIGMDINTKELRILEERIKIKKLGEKIKTGHGSLLNNNFNNNSFDIIWEEGVFHIIGFTKAFKECHRILKRGGFLVLNDYTQKITPYLIKLESFGYKNYNRLELPDDLWWKEFYKPMEKTIINLLKSRPNLKKNDQINRFQKEIDMVKSNPTKFDCDFFIFQKI